MALQFFTTGQHAVGYGIKVLTHGKAGAGKTSLIPTAPSPIVLSAEAGTLSIAKQNMPGILIGSIQDLDDAYAWIVSSVDARPFQTVCLDSISEIAEKCLSTEKIKAKDPRAAYGEMQDKINVRIRMFRDLPGKNVYFSCKSELREQPDARHLYAPNMPGKNLSQGIGYFFDEVFYLGIGETMTADGKQKTFYRYLQTQEAGTAEAKDRSGALAPVEEPNLTKIFNKIRAHLGVPPLA